MHRYPDPFFSLPITSSCREGSSSSSSSYSISEDEDEDEDERQPGFSFPVTPSFLRGGTARLAFRFQFFFLPSPVLYALICTNFVIAQADGMCFTLTGRWRWRWILIREWCLFRIRTRSGY
jgi:hypothetical protein